MIHVDTTSCQNCPRLGPLDQGGHVTWFDS
uniref:Uncharacterized protein n=1 Tax=Arundo donax TaxID=35708 RepID=A0A0A9B4F4_ARUDO